MPDERGRGRVARTKRPSIDATRFGPGSVASVDVSPLKRLAIFQICAVRFGFPVLRMSLSRNRCPLSGDMLEYLTKRLFRNGNPNPNCRTSVRRENPEADMRRRLRCPPRPCAVAQQQGDQIAGFEPVTLTAEIREPCRCLPQRADAKADAASSVVSLPLRAGIDDPGGVLFSRYHGVPPLLDTIQGMPPPETMPAAFTAPPHSRRSCVSSVRRRRPMPASSTRSRRSARGNRCRRPSGRRQ